MNKIYRLIWSKAKEMWLAVSEKVAAGWYRRPLTVGGLALAALLAAGAPARALDPNALPTGGQVVAGQAAIAQAGNTMTVSQQTDRLIAQWNSFNIGRDASVAFQQPGVSSVALNRILDQNPSQIFGSLAANGQVFLLNPAGVFFGPTARVDVGGLVASSLHLANEDFLAGKYSFAGSSTAGAIANQGQIRTAEGGYVAFLSPRIVQEGTITAPRGTVAMAAGEKVDLDFTGDRLVHFTVTQGAIDAQIANKGLIRADDGLVMLTAKAADALTQAVVNNDGVIEAAGLHERGGRILLDAEGGQTTVAGTLDASSAEGRGGRIVATGDRVLIASGAHLTASGATGGGEVLVGGSWQNSDPAVRQAVGTVVETGALLEANATDRGDGGTVVAWSDVTNPGSVTRAYGAFEAKGGPAGGDGGRIETSGHWLDASGAQGGASAPLGRAGEWLFDPYNVTITGATANGAWGGGNPDLWTPSASGSTILNTDINNKLENGTSVTVTTNGGGAEIGDITVGAAVTKASGNADVTLTLQAANSISVDEAISNTGGTGKLHVVLDADNDNGTRDGGGVILLSNDISTGGGNLSFGTGATLNINGVTTLVGGDVYVAGAGARSISTSGGSVDVKGEMIVANTNGLTISTDNGNVRFHGLLNSGNQYTFVDKTGSAGTGTWDDARTEAKNGTGGGSAVNDSYLVTITSRLENAIAVAAAGYKGSWIGAYRPNVASLNWYWADGPEGGAHFFTQISGGGGSATGGYYANFGAGEPNGSTAPGGETRGQFFGTGGQWNDLVNTTTYKASQGGVYDVLGFVRETNLPASPVTVNAGAGTVTFSGAVGTSKALASLNVTAATTAINGGAVITDSAGVAGGQSYSGNVTLGSAATTLTQRDTPSAFTVAAGKSITNLTGADATLTVKNTGAIVLDAGSAISSAAGKLNTVLWSDTDANGGYIKLNSGSSITTNGGHLWMGGGSGSTAWNGLTVGDGRATGNATQYEGIYIDRGTLSTGGGHAALLGKGHSAASVGGNYSTGVAIGGATGDTDGTASVNTGAGDLLIDGYAQAAAGAGAGVELAYYGTATTVQSTSGDITIQGDSESNRGIIFQDNATVAATGGGAVTLEGTARSGNNFGINLDGGNARVLANSGLIRLTGTGSGSGEDLRLGGPIGSVAGGLVENSTSDIEINADSLTAFGANTRFQSTGALTLQPRTAGTTIGIAGGAGTLQLPAGYFTTNFADGFSGITVGKSDAGLISLGGSALSYNDPLTLKTGNSIFFGTASAVAGNGNALTLWTRAGGNDAADDGVNGSVWMPVGSTVDTGGGDVTIGGGSDPTVGYALGDIGAGSDENNARYRGVTINGTLDAGGGNVSILGRGGNMGSTRGVSIGGAVSTSGDGNITVKGVAKGVSDGLALGDTALAGSSLGTLTAQNGHISLYGTKDTGSNGINLSTADSRITTNGTGSLTLTATGNIGGTGAVAVGGATTLTAGVSHITLANAANDFTGAVSVVSGNNVSLRDSNALDLGASTIGGNLTLQTGGALTQSGALAVTGTTGITAGADNDITLNNGANDFTGAVAVVSGNNVSLRDSNALGLGAVSMAGHLTAEALGGDLTIGGNISKTSGTDATAALKATGSIVQNAAASITSTSNKLHTILWSDADNSGSGHILVTDGNTIDTNGGNLVMAGGLDDGANGGTSGDGIPDGYAVSNTANRAGVGIGRPDNTATAATTLQSGGGDIILRGRSTGAGGEMGVYFAHSGTLAADDGTLTILGESAATHGVELSAWVSGLLNISGRTVSIQGKTSAAGSHGLATSELGGKYASITAGAGGITLYGEHTGAETGGIQMAVNLTATGGGAILIESPDTFWFYNAHNAHSYSAGTGDITIRANGVTNSGSAGTTAFSGTGDLTIEPYSAGTTIGIAGGAGTLQLPAGYFTTNFTDGFSGITVGRSDGTGKITAGAFAVNDALTLRTDSGGIELTGLLNAGANTVTVNSTGSVTDSGSGAIAAGGLALLGAGGNFTLDGTGNDVDTLAADTGSVTYVDGDALTIGTVNPTGITATGPVNIATLTGDLTVSQNIVTSDTSNAAIVLNAGKSVAAGTAAGGNIVLSGSPAFTTGAGGRTTLYTGGISGSTGLTALLGSGSGRFRYHSDETATNYTTALGAGSYAIYREQPTVSVTPGSQTITYGDAVPGFTPSYTGFVNGDTGAVLTGSPVWTVGGANSTGGHKVAGIHDVAYASGLGNGLGYAIADAPASTGELTVNKYNLAVSGLSASDKVYDATTTAVLTGTATITPLAGDAVVLGGTPTGAFADKNAGTAKAVTVSGSTISGADAGNYNLLQQAGFTASIAAKTVQLSATKTYDGTTDLTGAVTLATGIAGESLSYTGATALSRNATDNATNCINAITLADGAGGQAGNYRLPALTHDDAPVTITPAALTVTAKDAAKTYGQTVTFGGTEFTSAGLLNGETIGSVTLASAGASAAAGVTGSPYAITASNADGGTFTAGNYAITYQDGKLTVRANSQGEAAEAAVSSPQRGMNGTGQESEGTPGASSTPSLGPGAGSGNIVAASVIAPHTTIGAVLATTTFSTPVTLSATGTTMTLSVAGTTASGPMTEVGALPIFTQNGGAPPALQGNFLVRESGSALSLTPAGAAGVTVPLPAAGAGEKSAPFTLTQENGLTLQMTASVTADGVLVVSAPDTAGVDVQQAILIGAQVARQALRVELSSLNAALFVSN